MNQNVHNKILLRDNEKDASGYEPPDIRGAAEFWSSIFSGGWAFLKF